MLTDCDEDVRYVIGCMTGTSIDVALVCVVGAGLTMSVRAVLGCESMALGDVALRLRAVAEQKSHSAGELAALMDDFSRLHNEVIGRCRAVHPAVRIDLIAVHGQTVFHQPPLSWQMMQPALVAYAQACPVVYDLRAADLAAGGEGAPMTPLADWIMFRHLIHSRAIVNAGGFCNATFLPAGCAPEEVRGGDVCACNHILDAIARRYLDCAYDGDGAAAMSGQVDADASAQLVQILTAQQDQQRSLGSGDEALAWVDIWGARLCSEAQLNGAADLAASACDALGRVIAESCARMHMDEIICAGGGAYNHGLMAAIARHSTATVSTSERLGVNLCAREAIAMAVLGCLCQDRVGICLPAITAVASARIAGHWVLP